MSEPFVERLSRFTPHAGGLDRDALLFAAGRGSVRPNRGWIALAALLANTQVLSLVLLWPRPTPPDRGLTVAAAVAPVPMPSATAEPRTAEALANLVRGRSAIACWIRQPMTFPTTPLR